MQIQQKLKLCIRYRYWPNIWWLRSSHCWRHWRWGRTVAPSDQRCPQWSEMYPVMGSATNDPKVLTKPMSVRRHSSHPKSNWKLKVLNNLKYHVNSIFFFSNNTEFLCLPLKYNEDWPVQAGHLPYCNNYNCNRWLKNILLYLTADNSVNFFP